MPLFELKNICYKYDKFDKNDFYNIKDISFDINEKDFVAIVGKSGCGKSTLAMHLNGLLKADSGKIFYKGQDIYDEKFKLKNLRFDCGVVFQYPEYQLFDETVIKDICFGAIKKGLSEKEAYEKALNIMELLSISHLKDESPFVLSGGEKRKVALAGVFIMEPSVLVLDEPEAGIDIASKDLLFNFLKKMNKENDTTIIFITHDLDDAAMYANKVIMMNEGKVEKVGTPYEVFMDKDLIDRCSLDVPYSIQLINELNKKGAKLNSDCLNFDIMVNELCKILK